jgi:hypothetical protein
VEGDGDASQDPTSVADSVGLHDAIRSGSP